MPEPSKLSVKVTSESHGRKTRIGRLFTLDLLSSWIRRLELDEYTINGLIELASKYPAAALPSFRKNINLMIQRVRLQRQKDQQGEEISHAPEGVSQTSPFSFDDAYERAFAKGPQKTTITLAELGEGWTAEAQSEAPDHQDQSVEQQGQPE